MSYNARYITSMEIQCLLSLWSSMKVSKEVKRDLKAGVATKDDKGKPKITLLDTRFVEGMSKVMMYGLSKKYERDNWKKKMDPERLLDAMLRHAFDIAQGELIDPESGLPHAFHIACNAMMYSFYTTDYDEY